MACQVEHGFAGLATARSLDELGALSGALFEVKAHMLALEDDLAAIKPPQPPGTSAALPASAGRLRAGRRAAR